MRELRQAIVERREYRPPAPPILGHGAHAGEERRIRREASGEVFREELQALQRSASTVVTLPEATNDTLAVAGAATSGARRVWRSRYRYSKAGLVTVDLVPIAGSQRALPGPGAAEPVKSAALMVALDACTRASGAARWYLDPPVPRRVAMVDEDRDALAALHNPLDELPVVGAA